jgi:protein PhnA
MQTLINRSQNTCELCGSKDSLSAYSFEQTFSPQTSLLLCETCLTKANQPTPDDESHWTPLSQTLWSSESAVQMMTYRILSIFKDSSWARELLDQMYLSEDLIVLATQDLPELESGSPSAPLTKDSNGTPLNEGDSVTLIKDLDVKGAGFTAKRGTLVRDIRLTDNPKHIEGKVNGVQIVLVAAYLKKA